jgi:WD40 repeat protein
MRRLAIVDLATGLDRGPRAGHRRVLLNSALSPDGQSAYTIATEPTIRKWETRSTQQTNKLKLPSGSARSIDVSRDGKLVLVGTGDLLYFVDADTMKISGEPLEQQRLTSVAFSPTDDLVVARSYDGSVSFINPITRETVALIDIQLPDCHMGHSVFTSDGTRLALVSPTQSRIDILDTHTRKTLRTIQIHEQMVSLFMPACFLPDGKSLASLTVSLDPNDKYRHLHHIDIQDVVTGNRIRRLRGKLEYPSAIASSPQGDLIAVADRLMHEPGKTAYHAQVIRVSSTTTGKRLASFKGHFGTIRTLQFSPDGSSLYSTSHDTNVLIWNVSAAREKASQK